MRRLAAFGTTALILLTSAACGSDDEPETDPDPTSQSSDAPSSDATATGAPSTGATETGAPATGGALPSYEAVKALWLANTSDGDRQSCETSETEDKRIGAGEGDYIRFVCAGITRFDYVVGADNYADNFAAASSNLVGRAVFHVPDEAYVATAGANVDLAPAIQAACGCGEVVGPD